MQRSFKDANLKAVVNLPAAGATAYTPSLDFGSAGDPVLEEVEVEIAIPATPDLADDKTITCTLQDSADDSSFGDIEEFAAVVITGAGGVGAAASSTKLRLPRTTKRYVRLKTVVLAAGGDNTAIEAVVQLLF